MVTFEAGVFAVDEPCSFTPPNTLPEGSLALGEFGAASRFTSALMFILACSCSS